MDDFASVWNRVTGTQQPEHETTVLKRWIRDKMDSVNAYAEILKAPLPPKVRETLKRILTAASQSASRSFAARRYVMVTPKRPRRACARRH